MDAYEVVLELDKLKRIYEKDGGSYCYSYFESDVKEVMKDFLKANVEREVKPTLAEMLNDLPENRPLYKDSGLWQIRSDDMRIVIFEQNVNDTFEEFIGRVAECLDES